MKKTNLKIENLLIVKNSNKKSLIRIVWKNDYEGSDTDKFGDVFGILDLNLGIGDNNKFFDILNEGIKRYYESSLEYDTAFDDFINFLNRKIEQLINNKNLHTESNVLLGVIKDNHLLFCASGGIYAYFIHTQGIKKLYPEESSPINITNKLFTYSLNGVVNEKQTIYFCNNSLNEKINPFFLEKALKEHRANKVIEAIKDNILKNENDGNFTAFFFYIDNNKPDNTNDCNSGVLELFNKQEEMQNNLSPSILNNFKNILKQKSVLSFILKYVYIFFKKIFSIFKKIFLLIIFLAINAFFIITNLKGKRKEKSGVITERFKNIIMKINDVYRTFTVASKLIFLSIIITSVALAGFISYNIHNQKIKELKFAHSQKINIAENNLNEADANLLFNEKNIAIKKLKEGLSALEDIPDEIKDEEYNSLFLKLKKKLYEIRNISEIVSMVVIADFSLDQTFKPYSPIILEGGELKILCEKDVITVKTTGQNLEKRAFIISGLNTQLNYYYADKKILYSAENQTTLQASNILNLTSDIKEIALNPNENLQGFTVFDDRLYIASSDKKQFSIWKHSQSLTGFGRPTLSVNDNLPENSAIRGIRIDGNVFILFSNNEIYKYYKGIRKDWGYSPESIPGDEQYFKIETGEDYNNIYILSKHQVSILSKNGEFIAHMLFPNLKEIKDFAIDEKNETIYLLSDDKIYAFSISS